MRKQPETDRFSAYLLLMLAILAALTGVFVLYARAEKQIDRANDVRIMTFRLTQELRQSSDDLTRLARTFVVTGDPAYLRQYETILDVRDGKVSRPAPASSGRQADDAHLAHSTFSAGSAVALLDLMRQDGFTQEELSKLAMAKTRSDALATLERDTMASVASGPATDSASHARAIQALHDATYHQLKSEIMLPIAEIEQMVDARTLKNVHRAEEQALQLRMILIALGLAQFFLLWKIYQRLQSILGCSVQDLQSLITRLGSGRFSEKIDLPAGRQDSVLGWLIDANNKLSRLELRQYEAIVNSTEDAIISENLSGIVTSWNPAAERIFGYAAHEVAGQTLQVIIPPERFNEESEIFSKISLGESVEHFETVRVRKDGRLISVSVTASPIRDENGNIVGASKIARDITERKLAEQDLAKSTRALKTLSACSAALIHANDEPELLDLLCRLIVEVGGYRMAWVGLAEQTPEKLVRPLAWFGAGTDYLSTAKITWADDDWGRGPTGTAVRSGLVQVNQNYLTNPTVAIWRQSAIERGYRASIALPLRIPSGAPLVLAIYAADSDAFDPPELRLLEELADNLAYGINGIRNNAEKLAFAEQARKLSLAVEQSPESIAITGLDARIEYVNEAFLRNTGYSREDVIGQNPRVLQSGKTPAATYDELWKYLVAGQVWKGELCNRRKDGSEFTELAVISPLRDADGVTTHYVAVKEDITAKKQAEERIHHLAYFDSLTDLPNRRLLIDRLEVALADCARLGHQGALFYVDIDNFKTINDTLGHVLGDQLLIQVAGRLNDCTGPGDTVARVGGDDFILLLANLGADSGLAQARAREFGECIFAGFNAQFSLDGAQCRASPSVGVTLFGRKDDTVAELLKQVDLAMYEAKAAGRNTMRFFDAQVQAAMLAAAELDADLRAALERREFILHYQVQVDVSGQPVGVEALLRWQHPARGLLAPDTFIGYAEKTGLIVPIGAWVLESACAQLAAWSRQPGLEHLTLAVNVSAKQFRQPDFVSMCLETFARTGADPNRLKLEPTESVLLEDVEDAIAKMTTLRGHGVRFSLDDFGTGFSSLSYLRRLTLDQLKIDQSFVRDIPGTPNACVIVRTIIVLGQSLDLTVIAEGVETQEQRDFLADTGCRLFQGYLFGRPMPIADFEQAVARRFVAMRSIS